ncbi:hypothetical protein C823_001878 [Eubacterium plexicaudatum ASF492]|uniref:Ribosomal processing cysteine protease Prp n=1 Tax=Eubacterium plexicaudatum ASF492 TaxID=1235802 RepID=N2BFE1_9FIRM|nr:hypothetical protein C823_001878 [Eubacterium plexicaudatum ASF492]
MIKITIYRNADKQYVRLHCIGHAGFARAGEDIVCAGVSALVINTLNAMEKLTDETFEADTDQTSGLIDVRFQTPVRHDGKLLLDTLVLGLQDIQNQYGTDYSLLTFKEV